jgi:hypothetical protein
MQGTHPTASGSTCHSTHENFEPMCSQTRNENHTKGRDIEHNPQKDLSNTPSGVQTFASQQPPDPY